MPRAGLDASSIAAFLRQTDVNLSAPDEPLRQDTSTRLSQERPRTQQNSSSILGLRPQVAWSQPGGGGKSGGMVNVSGLGGGGGSGDSSGKALHTSPCAAGGPTLP